MGVRRTEHAVYDFKYHLVWISEYRKDILNKEVSKYLKDIFNKIAEEYEFKIDTMEVMEGHIHVFVEVPPRYSHAKVIQIIKSIYAREVFSQFPDLKKQLWAGEYLGMMAILSAV